jgi:hypothetical protein
VAAELVASMAAGAVDSTAADLEEVAGSTAVGVAVIGSQPTDRSL